MRPFSEALRSSPVFFEPAPVSQRASPTRQEAYRDDLVVRLKGIPRLDAVDLPELVDENHDGQPYYRSGDPRPLARWLSERLGVPAVVNKVVAYLPSSEALSRWTEETVRLGIRHVVLVGGSSRYIPYPGPPVVEANRICAGLLRSQEGSVGNIAIPQRTGEAHRMLAKTRAGASFFTTQIVLDSEAVSRMIREYDTLCRAANVLPAAVLLSVAALSDEGDAEFVRWLGADIPESAEHTILNGDEAGAPARSVALARQVLRSVRESAHRHAVEVPIGVNVEQISQRHLLPALAMLEALAEEIDRGR